MRHRGQRRRGHQPVPGQPDRARGRAEGRRRRDLRLGCHRRRGQLHHPHGFRRPRTRLRLRRVQRERRHERHTVSIAWGTASDRGNVVIGANYNTAGRNLRRRPRFRHATRLYLYGSVVLRAARAARRTGASGSLAARPCMRPTAGSSIALSAGGSWSRHESTGVDGHQPRRLPLLRYRRRSTPTITSRSTCS